MRGYELRGIRVFERSVVGERAEVHGAASAIAPAASPRSQRYAERGGRNFFFAFWARGTPKSLDTDRAIGLAQILREIPRTLQPSQTSLGFALRQCDNRIPRLISSYADWICLSLP